MANSFWESLPCRLRFRFALTLTRLACACWRGDRVTPIRPGVSWHWPRFMMAARGRMRRGSAGSGCRSCATGLSVSTPKRQRQALRQVVEDGPIPALHGVVRWRLIDLAQWLFEEFRVSISKPTLSRELRHMGFRKLSARPRHHAQDEEAAAAFKKTFSPSWRRPPQKRLLASR